MRRSIRVHHHIITHVRHPPDRSPSATYILTKVPGTKVRHLKKASTSSRAHCSTCHTTYYIGQTYSNMDFTEFDIGALCAHCKKHDYLPYTCQRCQAKFCQTHYLARDHSCPYVKSDEGKEEGDAGLGCNVSVSDGSGVQQLGSSHPNAVAETTSAVLKKHAKRQKKKLPKCRRKGCKRREPFQICCKVCNHHFCIQHRMPEHHECPSHMMKLAEEEMRQKHAAMMMNEDAKRLAGLYRSLRSQA